MPTKQCVLMSADPIALPLLEWLTGDGTTFFKLLEVVTQADKPSGRGKKITRNPIAQQALHKGIELYQPDKPDTALIQRWKTQQIDIVIVMAYGHILTPAVLQAGKTMLNLHTSLLPHYRGASPIETAIACGEQQTGISLMHIDTQMDAGNIINTQTLNISPHDTGGSLRKTMSQAAATLLAVNAPDIVAGDIQGTPQDDTAATYCRKLNKQDGTLNFKTDASTLTARIQAMTPAIGCRAPLNNDPPTLLRLQGASALPSKHHSTHYGSILNISPTGIDIACGNHTTLHITHLQRAGGKMMEAAPLAHGLPLTGQRFKSQAMTQLLRP